MTTRNWRGLLALTSALALFTAACGGGDADDGGAPAVDGSSEDVSEEVSSEEVSSEAASEDESAAPAGEGELLIWADERRIPPLEAIAPAFTEATGVEITVELVPGEEMRDQVTQAGPAGEGPDIFLGAHDWTGELAANGVIAPVDISSVEDQLAENAVDAFTFEGQTYALPYVLEAVAMYYNTDLVPELPATFEELGQFCSDEGIEQCVTLPGGGGAGDAYHNYALISEYGGTIFAFDEESGTYDGSTVRLDDPETIQGAEFLASQVEAGVIPDTDYDTAKNLFLEGTAPFFITGPWELGGFRDSDVSFSVAPIPTIDGNEASPFVGAQGFFLSQFSENALIAETFLLDFAATDEVMQALYDADPRGTAWNAVEESVTDDPEVQAFLTSASNGLPMPNVPEMAAVWGPLGDNLLEIRSGATAAEPAMTSAAEAVREAVGG